MTTQEDLQPGQRIRFLRTLDAGPTEETPAVLYAEKGDYGIIDRVGGCREGFWVFWDNWKSAAFGCSREDFEPVYSDEGQSEAVARIDLNRYCSNDGTRLYIAKPFLIDGYDVATNGHVLVARPSKKGGMSVEYNADAPISSAEELIEQFDGLLFKTAEVPDYPASKKCSICRGCGRSTVSQCEECDGDGVVEFSNAFSNYEIDCKSCENNGNNIMAGGENECLACDGRGTKFDRKYECEGIQYMGGLINPSYLLKILTDMPHASVCFSENDRIYFFSFGKAKAIVMGIRP